MEKQQIRQDMRAKRQAVLDHEIASAVEGVLKKISLFIPRYSSTIIGAYIPIRGEIDALAIATTFGNTIALPCIESDSKILIFREFQGVEQLVAAPHNTRQPSQTSPLLQPNILLVPLLAFDDQCYRLGYGGGYFDATIAALKKNNPAFRTIGLAYDFQRVDALPKEAHDVALDMIITPTSIISSAAQI